MKHLIDKEEFFSTEEYVGREAAIAQKMKALQPRLLGIPLVRYAYQGERKVFIPNAYLLMGFKIERNITLGNKSMFDKEGKVAVIFDMNEPHAFFYDTNEKLRRQRVKTDKCEGTLLPPQCTDEEMFEQVIRTVQRQVILKTYKTMGKVEILKVEKFYRPAWELSLESKGRIFTKYAYVDEYGSSSERIKGLKARLEV